MSGWHYEYMYLHANSSLLGTAVEFTDCEKLKRAHTPTKKKAVYGLHCTEMPISKKKKKSVLEVLRALQGYSVQ